MKSDDEPALNLSEEKHGLHVLSDSVEVEVSATSKTILPAQRSIPERFSETALIHSKAPNNTVSKQKRPEDQEDKNAKVTVLSVLLLLLFCAIALMLVGSSTSTSIITSLGIVALLLITIPIALALLIALLAVLFSKTHEQLSEQKRLEAEEKKKLEGMTPEEQEAYRRENAASVSRKKTDNIAAAIIAIAIVVLAIFVLTDK
jgi:protein-S-isoprenylcysteine O-methyltransferase Ste14